MKNGLLTVNNEDVLNYNSSNNIEIYNIKLKDYLNLLKKEMENYVINQKSYKMYQLLSNYTINATDTYEYLNSYVGTFAGRKNSINSVYSLNDNNYITLNENCPRENNYVKIRFDTQFFANGGTGNKYIQIQIIIHSYHNF